MLRSGKNKEYIQGKEVGEWWLCQGSLIRVRAGCKIKLLGYIFSSPT
jgi:hypothetical protein